MLKHATVPDYTPTGTNKFYHIQAFYVPILGFIICVIVGAIVSKFTGGFDPKKIDPRMMNNLVNKWYGRDINSKFSSDVIDALIKPLSCVQM